MKTKVVYLEGIDLVIHTSFSLPHDLIKDFPPSCGTKGLGSIVPDSLLGLSISPACSIHDDCFDKSLPIWEDFHISNNLFIRNILSLILGGNRYLIPPRIWLASTYFSTVDTVGTVSYTHLTLPTKRIV